MCGYSSRVFGIPFSLGGLDGLSDCLPQYRVEVTGC